MVVQCEYSKRAEKGEKMKAKYIGKYYGHGYDSHMVYLEYEYRGIKYTVYENRAKGNEPLSWQHSSEQARIDRMLDTKCEATSDAQAGLDLFFEYYEI